MISNGVKKLVPQSLKNIYHLFQAILANVWFGFPSRKLKVIGVTGTNGKTTTCQMISRILEENGFKVAMASTINFKIGEKEWVNATKFTTLSSWRLQKHLRSAVRAGCEYAIIEVTSHALDQNRVWGVDFSIAVITNITREHLDYHETMEKYALAKEKLFAMVAKNKKSVSVVNLDSEFVESFLSYPANEKYGYYLETRNTKHETKEKFQIRNYKLQEIIAENIELNIHNTQYTILNTQFHLNLPGQFNIENALAATCVGLSQGISLEKISEALGKIKGVPGRMERIENNRGLEIIVDYAVTPDSLEKLYGLIDEIRSRPHPNPRLGKERERRIISVFGACGERDRGKRPIMGEIVAKYADYCIVTNEDPYEEDPQQIIDEVFAGVIQGSTQKISKVRPFPSSSETLVIPQGQNLNDSSKANPKTEGFNAFRIMDRKEAIKKALQIAKPGDIVVVTGKGAEEIMVIGEKRIPWNDPKIIREVLQERE